MLVTEKQAREMWCPEARTITKRNPVPHNRWVDNNDHNYSPTSCQCIASKCMFWRWHIRAFFSTHWKSGSSGEYMNRKAKPFGSVDLDDIYSLTAWVPENEKAVGYCGKAGKP